MPNFICGAVLTIAFINILNRFDEMALPDDDVAIGWNFDPDRVQVHVNY
jgi:hypothetical protein